MVTNNDATFGFPMLELEQMQHDKINQNFDYFYTYIWANVSRNK